MLSLYNQDTVAYDNLVVSDPPTQPLLGIQRPIAHSVTPGGPVDLSVSAVTFKQLQSTTTVAVEVDGVVSNEKS